MSDLHILDHPLIQSKLTRLRAISTNDHAFRLLLEELTAFMVCEITRGYPLRKVEVETPFERTTGKVLDLVVLVPWAKRAISSRDWETRVTESVGPNLFQLRDLSCFDFKIAPRTLQRFNTAEPFALN